MGRKPHYEALLSMGATFCFFYWRQILMVNWLSHARKVLLVYASCVKVLMCQRAYRCSQFCFCVQVASMTLQALILFVFIETLPTYVTCADGEWSQKYAISFFFRILAQPPLWNELAPNLGAWWSGGSPLPLSIGVVAVIVFRALTDY